MSSISVIVLRVSSSLQVVQPTRPGGELVIHPITRCCDSSIIQVLSTLENQSHTVGGVVDSHSLCMHILAPLISWVVKDFGLYVAESGKWWSKNWAGIYCHSVEVILFVILSTCSQKGRREGQNHHMCKKVPFACLHLQQFSATLWPILWRTARVWYPLEKTL